MGARWIDRDAAVPIGQWMLREACRQGRRWHDAGFPVVVAVIAEGAQTAEQLHYLRQHGCDEYQGFYAAQAVPKSV